MDEKNNKKVKNAKQTLLKLVKYISVYKFRVLVALIAGVSSIIINVITPRLISKIINEIYNSVTKTININIHYITNIIFELLGLYLLGVLLLYLQGYIIANISVKLTFTLRKNMDEKINKLPISYFDEVPNGEILARLTSDVERITSVLRYSVTEVVNAVVTIVGIIAMMYTINWICATVTVATVFFTYVIMQFIVKKSQRFFKEERKFIGKTNGYIEEIYSQHNIVKAFNAEKSALEVFEVLNDELYKSSWKASFFSALLTPIVFFMSNINYLIVVITACVLTVNGKISVGDIQAFIQYVKNLNQPMNQMANITSNFQGILAAAERVFDFLEEEEEKVETNTIDLPKSINGNIRFENVTFGYKKGETTINRISLEVKAGQKVALVGATGSGKTTLVKLLMRFYELNSGKIYIDGIDITKFSKNSLRSIFSMVLQDAWLYSGTIADNIKYGNINADDKQVEEVAKLAYVDNFIKTLPEGYKTVLNDEATNISQGEKQLITIARAMLVGPQILILDEATSSVDMNTESLIQKAMDNLMKGKTSFIIAHRLSTVKNADVIFVMSHGEILEHGSHQELIKKGGYYCKMYNSQFEI